MFRRQRDKKDDGLDSFEVVAGLNLHLICLRRARLNPIRLFIHSTITRFKLHSNLDEFACCLCKVYVYHSLNSFSVIF